MCNLCSFDAGIFILWAKWNEVVAEVVLEADGLPDASVLSVFYDCKYEEFAWKQKPDKRNNDYRNFTI